MDHPALPRHAEAASAPPGRPSGAGSWRRRLPSRDALVAWLAAVAAMTVFIDFAATF